ncbi:polyhydroxyalkanoic acid system family protein [Sphingomonas jaspsi]|uniref:polyhydroxyalkanoic acid system family protein n=1 Tax=Sphingomonas jaspsi TaxID=392409 RepID=UPI0004B988E0|nr:polyhydroxyalkanoic acid system family protein [Sphingomonas jaspsi]
MSYSHSVDVPHRLGRQEAHRRIADNVHKLENHLPGAAEVKSGWAGDTLNLDIGVMGQALQAELVVEDERVICRFNLPGMLSFMAGPIEAALRKKGSDLLLDDKRGD